MINEINLVEAINLDKVGVKYEHVMLVDDDPIQNMLHGKLMDHGMFAKKVSTFSSAQEALLFLFLLAMRYMYRLHTLSILYLLHLKALILCNLQLLEK